MKRLRLCLGLSAMTLLATASGCANEENDASDEDIAASTFRPTAAWVGRVVLPKAGERAPDGAVRFEVHAAAKPELVGKTVWLRFAAGSVGAARSERTASDIRFTNETKASIQKGNVHPGRLDGWSHVSSLESLAGAHETDDVLVRIENPTERNGDLVIQDDPVQVADDEVALAQFVSVDSANGTTKVKLYDRASQSFPTSLTMSFVKAPHAAERLQRLVASPENREGFYVYAHRSAGARVISALEPRSARKLAGAGTPWSNTKARRGELHLGKGTLESLGVGQRLLVTHTFGGIGPAEDKPLVTGHFAFGVAKVVTDPATGEPALETTYEQVYAHNPNGIIAGAQDAALYRGSLEKGWMFARPIVDTYYSLPLLERDFKVASSTFRPLDAMVSRLRDMEARYRTGNGTGAAIVTPANSCVQDSSQALFSTVLDLDDVVKRTPDARGLLDQSNTSPDAVAFRDLTKLADRVESYLSPLGIPRLDWLWNRYKPGAFSACPGGTPGAVVCALGSYRTILPGAAEKAYGGILRDAGAKTAVYESYIFAGDPQVFPVAPTAP